MAEKRNIAIELPLPGGKELKDCAPAEISAAMNTELDLFDRYMVSINQGALVPMEKALIKTYLAWKLVYEPKANPNPRD